MTTGHATKREIRAIKAELLDAIAADAKRMNVLWYDHDTIDPETHESTPRLFATYILAKYGDQT